MQSESSERSSGRREPLLAETRDQLARILASPTFESSARRKALLRYLVEEALAGRADRLKGYTIGVDVFGLGETFDPKTDPFVRLEARRLRRDLDGYYAAAGARDPVRISVPKALFSKAMHFSPQALPMAAFRHVRGDGSRWIPARWNHLR